MATGGEAAGLGCAVIYAVGTPGTPGTEVPALQAYVAGEGWMLVDICFDQRNSAHPVQRPGLRMALDRLHLGLATVLVLDQAVHISMPERSWLDAAVRTCGGSLRRVIPTAKPHTIPEDHPSLGAGVRLAGGVCDAMSGPREAG